MENRTDYDLNKNIEIWKSDLFKNSKMTIDNINELESHLRDEVHELQLLGLSIEESLLIAKQRIGNVKDLSTEFGKVNKGFYFRNRMIPYLKGILLFMAFITTTGLLVNLSLIISDTIGINSKSLNYISIGILIFSSLILLTLAYVKYKSVSLSLRKLTNVPFLIGVIIFNKLLTLFSTRFIYRSDSIEISDFGNLQMNLNVYNLLFGLFILSISFIIFYVTKRENKAKIVE